MSDRRTIAGDVAAKRKAFLAEIERAAKQGAAKQRAVPTLQQFAGDMVMDENGNLQLTQPKIKRLRVTQQQFLDTVGANDWGQVWFHLDGPHRGTWAVSDYTLMPMPQTPGQTDLQAPLALVRAVLAQTSLLPGNQALWLQRVELGPLQRSGKANLNLYANERVTVDPATAVQRIQREPVKARECVLALDPLSLAVEAQRVGARTGELEGQLWVWDETRTPAHLYVPQGTVGIGAPLDHEWQEFYARLLLGEE